MMPIGLALYILGHSVAGWSLIAVYAQYQRRVLGAMTLPVILLSLAIFEWTIFYAVEIAVPYPELKLIAHHLKYIGMTFLPVPGLLFVIAYIDPTKSLTHRQLLLLCVVPALTLIIIFTNSLHHLMWTKLEVITASGLTVVAEQRGIWDAVQGIYAYAVYALILRCILLHLRKVAAVVQYKYSILLVAFLFPGLASLNLTFQWSPLDFTPFALTVAGMSVAWNLFSYRLIDLAPLARNIVTESMKDGMIVLDADGKVFSINPVARAILGDSDTTLIGQSYDKVLFDLMQRGASAGGYAHESSGVIHTLVQGEMRYLELRVSMLHEEGPEPVGRVVVIRDITRHQEAETRLKAALEGEKELNALRAHFVSIVSHEFRTPMSIIQTATEMLMRYRDRMPADVATAKFATITSQIALMNALIDDVLSLDRLQTGALKFSPEVMYAVDMVRGLVDEIRQDEGVASRIEFDPTNVDVKLSLDKQLIRLVVRNLVSNALKYSPDDEPVTVKLDIVDESLRLQVIDRGIGIPESDQARLFDAFYRAANVGDVPGSGLGLMIVKQAVDLHGGKTHFTSSAGGGTTFSVLLPLTASPGEAPTEALA